MPVASSPLRERVISWSVIAGGVFVLAVIVGVTTGSLFWLFQDQ